MRKESIPPGIEVAAGGSETQQGLKAACVDPSIRKSFRREKKGAYCNDDLSS